MPHPSAAKYFLHLLPVFSSFCLTVTAVGFLKTPPTTAHEVEISGDVAATFHLEPNHNPKAGQLSQTWIALTRKGGAIIPLNQCNCQLSVYSLPRRANSQPVLKPSLKSINAENYRGIPGADIIFPRAGAYQLELTGTSKAGATFKPFTVTFDVNVSK